MFPPVASGHPYHVLLAGALERSGCDVDDDVRDADILHFHWPEAPFNEATAWRAFKGVVSYLRLARRARTRSAAVVWTVHNLAGHESRWPGQHAFRSTFVRLLDGWIAPSRFARSAISTVLPRLDRLPASTIPLGDLSRAFPPLVDCDAARRELGLDNRFT